MSERDMHQRLGHQSVSLGAVISETQRPLFNRRVSGLWTAGAFVLLAFIFVVRFLASDPVRHDPEPAKVRTFPPPGCDARTPPGVFEVSETYYRTIINNNLFRPLGWTRPRSIEPYRLLGTILASDETTPHKQFYNPPQDIKHISSH